MGVAGDAVDHPPHYGGKDNPFEAIKVIDDWRLGFSLGNALKYIARHPYKGSPKEDLQKAEWYLDHATHVHELPNISLHTTTILISDVVTAWGLAQEFESILAYLKRGSAHEASKWLNAYIERRFR